MQKENSTNLSTDNITLQQPSIAESNNIQLKMFCSHNPNNSLIRKQNNNFANKRVIFCDRLTKILLIITAILVLLNLSIFDTTRWSTHVIACVSIILLCAIVPIKYHCSAITQIKLFITTITITTIATEVAVSRKENIAGYSVFIILPIVYIVTLLFIDIVLLFKCKKNFGWFNTLMYCTAFSLLPQILLWANVAWFTVTQNINTITRTIIYNLPFANLIIMLAIRFKYAMSELARTYYF